MSLVKENDWNLLLGTFLLASVTGLANWIGACAWLPRRRLLPRFALVGLGSPLGFDSPPERLRSSVTPVRLGLVVFNMGRIRLYLLVVKRLKVPILEKGTLGTEESIVISRREVRKHT